jgi:putative phosphoribosyl transferase
MKAMRMGFQDRGEAGRQLGRLLGRVAGEQPIVIAVARGGVPVGFEVARALGAPLEVLAVRKLVSPRQPERTVGAVAEGGVLIVDERMARPPAGAETPLPPELLAVREREEIEIERRVLRFRGGQPLPSLRGRVAIVVDDGVTTGLTARAAVAAVYKLDPRRLIFAVPVGSLDVVGELRTAVDELVCVETRLARWAIGLSYSDFTTVDDEQVIAQLEAARNLPAPIPSSN